MGLQNVDVHTRCFCYDGRSAVIESRELASGDERSVDLHDQEILFVLKGSVHIRMDMKYERTVEEGEFIFLPVGVTLSYKAEADSTMLSFRLPDDTPECHIFRLNKISERIENPYEGIYALRVNDRMQTFLSGFMETFTDGLRCRHYLEMEASRMLYLIHAYYPQEDHIKFFSHTLSPDVKFSEFVRTNWMKYNTVGDMANAMFMTPQQFSAKFKKIFGTTPFEWKTQQKALKIYQDICRSDISLKEIAIKYDFPLQSNFFRFCKQAFGESPGQIRKNLKNGLPPR